MLGQTHRRNYSGALTNAQPSPNIWSKVPWELARLGQIRAIAHHEDFANPSVYASATVQAGVKTYQDTGVTVQGLSGLGGILQIAGADAAGDDGAIEFMGGGTAGAFSISSSAPLKFALEMRVKSTLIAQGGLALGAAEPGFAANAALADTTAALSDKDFVGFHMANASASTSGTLNAVYRKSGQAATNAGTAVAAQTLAAATWVKLGLLYEPYYAQANGTHRLTWYVNNVQVQSFTDIDAATFPDGELLTPVLTLKSLDTNQKLAQIDWFRVFQQFE